MVNRRAKGEGTVFQRADGTWIGRLSYEDPLTGARRRTQVSGATKSAARGKLNELRDRVGDGKPARDARDTFGAFTTTWVETSLEVSDRKRSTKTLYAGLARTHVVDSSLGRTPLDRIRPTTVERFIAELRGKGLSESTVRQVYTVARAVGDAAVRDRLLGVNPFGQVKRPRVTKREASHLSAQEVRQLVDAAEGSRYADLFVVLAWSGLRRGEALALRWADVDYGQQTARVRGTLARQDGALVVSEPKTASSRRTVPLSPDVAEAFRRVESRTSEERARAGSKWHETGFVFVTELGEPCDPRNALRALTVAAERAGLPGVGLHTLRHSAASLMLSAGVPLTVVSKMLGHSGIAITADVYGHVAPEVALDAANALAAAYRGP